MKTLVALLSLSLFVPVVYAGDCATGITEQQSHVILDSTLVADSGLIAGDRVAAFWQDDAGGFWCAGQSEPYVPGLTFAIHPVSGERLEGAFAVTIWMDDPLVDDDRDWPFGTAIYLLVERGGIYFETLATADAAPPPFPNLGEQPWEHTGGNQIFWLSDFVVLIVVAVEGRGSGVISAPYPNPSGGTIRLPRATAFRVYDLSGHFVLEGAGSRIELSGLPTGRYLVRVQGQSYLITLIR